MKRRIRAIMRKEFIHIFRDWRTLLIIVLMPVMMIVLYGYAITMDMRNIRFAVIDESGTPESRDLVRAFDDNAFFMRVPVRITRAEVGHLFSRREANMVLVIGRDYAERLRTERTVPVQLLIDASDSNVGTFINTYTSQVLRLHTQRLNGRLPAVLTVEPRIFYNPDMRSANFFVPGLVALILILISALLTSIAITREKETGTMEQILVSPIRPLEIIIGKVAPYITLGFFNGAMILLFARILFDVPIRGNLVLLGALALVYIFVSLSFGLMISTVARTQQIAMLMTLMATILPTIMMSGFIFPISSMPWVLQIFSRIIPATYFLIIIRGILIKGVGIAELWPQVLMLTGIGLIMIVVAVRRFRTTLE